VPGPGKVWVVGLPNLGEFLGEKVQVPGFFKLDKKYVTLGLYWPGPGARWVLRNSSW